MFYINGKGKMEFKEGKEAWTEAEITAKTCKYFRPDDEDEQVTETLQSCYNCCFRRWTMKSFICLKESGK